MVQLRVCLVHGDASTQGPCGRKEKEARGKAVADPRDMLCRPGVWTRLEGCKGDEPCVKETDLARDGRKAGERGVRVRHEERQLGMQKSMS